MSSEYTIDIQLTELGFPEILQSKEPPVEETPRLVASSSFPLPLSPPPPLHSVTSGVVRPRPAVDKDRSGVGDPQATAAVTLIFHQTTTVSGLGIITNTEGGKITGESETENGRADVNGQKAKGNLTGAENESEDTDDSGVDYVEEEDEDDEEDDEDLEGLEEESGGTGDHHCSVCDLLLPSYFKLQDHMNLHTGVRPYCCAECGKRFCQIHNYRSHLRTHAQSSYGGAGLDPLRCRVCLKGFQTDAGLAEHLATSHFETEFYECDLCKRIFTDLKVCEKHMEGHRRSFGDHECDACGRCFTKQKFLNQHRQRVCQRSYSCTDCARVFRKKNALLRHSFTHLGLLPYTCVRCSRHFRLAKFYRKHKCEPERIHCVACLGVFLSQEDFQKHKKDTGCWGHQGSRGGEIRCMECGQGFASAEELKNHGGAHQRVLSCSECGKGFRSALLLMSHMGGHAGQRPCLCQSCGLGFPHQQAYDSHLKDCGRKPAAKRQASKTSPHTALPKKSKTQLVPGPPAPGNVASAIATAAVPADGVWKLALDKQPPAGVSLVIFVPANLPSTTNALSLPLPDVQSTPGMALPPALPHALVVGLHEATSFPSPVAAATPISDVPLDLAVGHKDKREPDNVSPLDLSKKPTSPESALSPDPREPTRPEFPMAASGEGDATERERQLNPDPMDLSSLKSSGRPLGPTADIKKEPQSRYGLDSSQTESRLPTALKMKTEEGGVEGHEGGDARSPPAACSDPVGESVKEEAGLNCGERRLACEGTSGDGE